jgi:hypothetical protein
MRKRFKRISGRNRDKPLSLRKRKTIDYGSFEYADADETYIRYYCLDFKFKLVKEWDWHNEGYNYGYYRDQCFVSHRENGPSCTIGKNRKGYNDERWHFHGIELYKEDFTSIEQVHRLKAWSLFSPVEIVALKKKSNGN